ncbi:probable pectin methyltransferase QUA2 [Tanacetum coccineum]
MMKRSWKVESTCNTKSSLVCVLSDDLNDDNLNLKSAVRNYWSLLSPLIFLDHPRRPGIEDPVPPYNMVRNVLDMNAHFGDFNCALLELGNLFGS